ncbi:hypothetical protein [Saccharothrix longispora]|uniref:hypothetical protein n=1 Tax=Saccharothrix longispora TaxID=33920 RepID=UPI0028FD4B5F|nr:hypothetical protein [Saccharothrix longispora]MBY8851192.1 hypothetical protein [Saccharothrix sp. MB29]MDU0290732.1 hypothetical protein [Saccharothrix longispora]
MQLQLVIPVKRSTLPRLLAVLAVTAGSLAVMWALFGWLGAAVLALVLSALGHLLVRAARGQ